MLYKKGKEAYNDKNWQVVVDSMENAVQQYYVEHEFCLAACDSPFDPNTFQTFLADVTTSSDTRPILLSKIYTLTYIII